MKWDTKLWKCRLAGWILAILAAASLWPAPACAQGDYVLYVGGVEVTRENSEDVLGDGTVRFTDFTFAGKSQRTLYLDKASITGAVLLDDFAGEFAAAIYTDLPLLEIYLYGHSTVTVGQADEAAQKWYGIYSKGSLNLRGGGKSLTVGLEEIAAPRGATALSVDGNLDLETVIVQAGCGRQAVKSPQSSQTGVYCSGVLAMQKSMLIAYTSGEALGNLSAAISVKSIEFIDVAVLAFSGDTALVMRNPDAGVMFAFQGQDWYGSPNYDGSGLKACTAGHLYAYRHLQILPKGTPPVQ